MTTPRERYEGFLAKWLDPATTDAEAEGAVVALVKRLRAHHRMGETDLVLALVTQDEKRKLDRYRERVGTAAPTPSQEEAPKQKHPPISTKEVVDTALKTSAFLDAVGFWDWIDRPRPKPKKEEEL